MEKWIKNMQQALIKKEDVNVIIAGWKDGAKQNIFSAIGNTRLIGSMVNDRLILNTKLDQLFKTLSMNWIIQLLARPNK